ncbi:YggT family protein [Shewanella corallii]|uniref:YggT family protein n=2 Tax=Shewanella TaxID=22 RepID=A0ABT0N4E2_9GAMM|nr:MULTISPECIES: YggT family protein [Shewanella]MCL1036840.1 YggT family protein [Shewanella submarina]MCL2913323.1 YggT family protein [Shewanella corallii]
MNASIFLINTLFELYLMVVILRIWLQLAKADFYNPLSQFVVKATHPLVAPMRRVLPAIGSLDTASVVLAILVVVAKLIAISLVAGAAIDPVVIALFSLVAVIKKAGFMLFWMLIIRAILSWFNNGYNPIVMVIEQLTEPVMAPVRKIIPPIGGLDLSVMLVLIGMNFLNLLLSQYIPFWANV